MRKFRFIGTEGDIFSYTPDVADRLVIGKVYSEKDLEKIYGSTWEDPDVNLIDTDDTDWEEVFDDKEETKSPDSNKNVVSISGFYNGVVFSLSGNFEKCLTVLDFISTLEVEKE